MALFTPSSVMDPFGGYRSPGTEEELVPSRLRARVESNRRRDAQKAQERVQRENEAIAAGLIPSRLQRGAQSALRGLPTGDEAGVQEIAAAVASGGLGAGLVAGPVASMAESLLGSGAALTRAPKRKSAMAGRRKKTTPVPGLEGGAAAERRMGEVVGMLGTVKPQARLGGTVLRDRQRMAYPGIYGDPREIVADVTVAPEDPLLQRLFGVSRRDLSEQVLGRQSSLPDWQPEMTKQGRGSAAAQRIMTPSNERRIGNILEAAMARPDLREGMTGWYNLDPLYRRQVELLGEEEAARLFKEQQAMIGMASPGSDVLTEVNRGSRADWLHGQGRFPEFWEHGGTPAKTAAHPLVQANPEEMAGLLGHPYHRTSQALPMQTFLETGSYGGAAKVPSYIMAARPPELGMQMHYPVGDAHWARGVGLADVRTNKGWGASATLPEMTTLAPWYRNIAQQQGLESVPAQALQWGTLANQTGVKTGGMGGVGAPKLELIAQAIGKTAQRTGRSPEEVRDLFLSRRLPIGNIDPTLLAAMGAGSAGLALGGPLAAGYFANE